MNPAPAPQALQEIDQTADLAPLPGSNIHRLPKLTIWLGTFALLALVWTHVLLQTKDMHTRAFNSANNSLADITRVTQEHAVRTFRGADQALRFVLTRFDAEGDKLDLKALVDLGVIDASLFSQIGIIDANGLFTLSSIPFKKGLDLSDREHFKVHTLSDTGLLYISKPVLGRATGKWAIQLSRRINRADGSFGGVAVVSIAAEYFSRFYADLTPQPSNVSALVGLDGVVRVRQLGNETSFGESVLNGPAVQTALIGAMLGSYTGKSNVDGVERLFNFRRIPGYPLLTLNGVSTASVRATYQPVRNALIFQASLLSLLLIGMALALLRYSTLVQRDMDLRQVTAQALRNSEQRLELALIGGKQGAWDLDLRNDTMYVSALLLNMMGHEGDGRYLTQEQRLAFVDMADLRTVRAELLAHLKGQTDYLRLELRLRCKNGSFKWVLIQGKIVDQIDGRSTRLAGSATDISEQHFIQGQVMDRTAQLDAIFTLSPDAFVSFDREYRVKYVNPAFTRITGLSWTKVKQLSESEFSEKLGALCITAKPFRGVEDLRINASTSDETYQETIELLPPNRSVLKVSLKISDSASVSQILYLRDVTHETIVEDMKTEFLSTAAHELRTPMASVLGFAELLLMREMSKERQKEFLTIILTQAKHLSTILDDLLDLARIESRQRKDFEFKTVELKDLVNEVVSNYKRPEGRSEPLVSMPVTHCKVDIGKAKQAILNVVSNAYKYSLPGTDITITSVGPVPLAGKDGLFAGIVVQDRGIGMSEDQLARVFERFYRADASGTVLGTGLGMSIVKEIMDIHGGDISVQSALGTGTNITLLFPTSDDAPAETSAADTQLS